MHIAGVANIKTDDGVVLMHIKDARHLLALAVPVHSFLIKLGFLDYVEEVRKLGHEGSFITCLRALLANSATTTGPRKICQGSSLNI